MAGGKLGIGVCVLPKAKKFGGKRGMIVEANTNGTWNVKLVDGQILSGLTSQQLKIVEVEGAAVAAAPRSRSGQRGAETTTKWAKRRRPTQRNRTVAGAAWFHS
jgi:hypothetical protein